ncbi:MAG: M23 family metallopeptidase [Actinomycetaceae bacterium]|nr:M23 family metallopeptidase [Actinomycetaceae bacterium]
MLQSPDAAQSPFPSRRELKKQRETASGKGRNLRRPVTAVARGLILASLAATTVAVPVTGFVGPEQSLTLPTKVGVIVPASESWAGAETVSAADAVGLSRVDTAASRERIRNPLEIGSCLENPVSANGERTVTEKISVVWPLAQGSFSFASPFGMRFHPILGISRLHAGADLAGPLGTPIYAAADGVVVDSAPQSGYGYWLRIRHEYPDGEVFYTGYAHMYAQDVLVHEGDVVTAGQQVASIGNTGYSTGPHLHFEVHDSSDTPFDPIGWLQENARESTRECN